MSQRRRELGVRAALGAAGSDLIALLVREALAVTVISLAIGLGRSCGADVMQSLRVGVTPLDPASVRRGARAVAASRVLPAGQPRREN